MARGGMGCLAGLVHFLVNDFFWFWGGGWIDEGRIREEVLCWTRIWGEEVIGLGQVRAGSDTLWRKTFFFPSLFTGFGLRFSGFRVECWSDAFLGQAF